MDNVILRPSHELEYDGLNEEKCWFATGPGAKMPTTCAASYQHKLFKTQPTKSKKKHIVQTVDGKNLAPLLHNQTNAETIPLGPPGFNIVSP